MADQDHSSIIGEEMKDAREDFAPCPLCKQYSHSIGEDQLAAAFNTFQSMFSHRNDGIPTQYCFDAQARDAAQVLIAAARNTRSPDVVTVMLDDSGIQAAEEAYDNFVREAGYRSPYLNTRAFRLAFEAALLKGCSIGAQTNDQ